MKIVTWNINSIRVREERALSWTAENKPDVLCLQEIKVEDGDFPTAAFRSLGYEVVTFGQRTYNGVALLSRAPIVDVVRGFGDGGDDTQSRYLGATIDGIRFHGVYVPNGQAPGTEKYAFKIQWLSRLERYFQSLSADVPSVLLGDFNVAPADLDVHDPIAWRGQIMCSDPERAALNRILGDRYIDSLRRLHPTLSVFTWWDYRQLSFPKNHGLRIDHVFATAPVAAQLQAASVDRNARKGKQPSDHAPVIVEIRS